MEVDTDKIDATVLALLSLTLHDGQRAWKGFDWHVLDRLHKKGFIENPVGKVKSVVLTDEGLQIRRALQPALFQTSIIYIRVKSRIVLPPDRD